MGQVLFLWLAVIAYAGNPQASSPETIRSLISAGRLEDAERRLAEEITARGENHQTRYLSALVLFKRRQFVEALKQLEQCLTLDPGDVEVYKLIALNGIALNRPEIAEPALRSALQTEPTDTFARFHLGILYYTTSRFGQAESEFRKVVQQNPTFMKAHDFLGLVQEELGTDEAVVASYHKAIQLVSSKG
jgi:Flp pilus assembly protein TadD